MVFFGNMLNKFHRSPDFVLTDLTLLISVFIVHMLIQYILLLAHIFTLFKFKIFCGSILLWKFNVAWPNILILRLSSTLNLIRFYLYRLFMGNLRTFNFFLCSLITCSYLPFTLYRFSFSMSSSLVLISSISLSKVRTFVSLCLVFF